jgi:ACS family hexuronate transporter-like MFS transporter
MNRRLEGQIVCFIACVTIINYFDRSAISFVIEPLQKELQINNSQFGTIASGFGIGYLIMAFLGGILIDRFNPVYIWAASAVLWSAATMSMGLANSFSSFLALRILLGIAEGVHFPALLKIITDWLEPAYRARSISIGLLGVPIASLIGAPFITFLIEWAGWRSMFVILGSLGVVWVIFWLILFRGKKNPRLETQAIFCFESIHWKKFFQSSVFITNCFVYFIFGYILFFALIWLPGYLEQVHHVSIKKTGFLVMVPWFVSALSMMAGGWVSDALYHSTNSILKARIYPMAGALLGSFICFGSLLMSDTIAFDLWMISLGLGSLFFLNAPIYAINADLFPRQVGVAQGIMSCFFALAGIVSPIITGWLVQISGTFHSAILLVALFSLVSSLGLILQRWFLKP